MKIWWSIWGTEAGRGWSRDSQRSTVRTTDQKALSVVASSILSPEERREAIADVSILATAVWRLAASDITLS